MKLVISPAKSLNYESELPTGFSSESCFLNEAKQLNELLKKKSPQALSDLMHISEKLGELNYNRNQGWSLPFTSDNARHAKDTRQCEKPNSNAHQRKKVFL